MFCWNCGTKTDGDARFCPECGVRLGEESVPAPAAPNVPASPAPVPAGTLSVAEEKAAAKKRGFIFTNVGQLARKFGVPAEAVSGAFDDFIREKKRFGVHYELIDVGDYAFRCDSRRVSLAAQNGVVDFLDVLLDAHNAEVRRGEPESTYLFIVGGHDTIPMPQGPYYFQGAGDATTDADLLYAFPYGKDAVAALHSAKIFAYDALFFVGRLPFASDSTFGDFAGYLSRAAQNGAGVPVRKAHAQFDPHFRAKLAGTALRERSLLPPPPCGHDDVRFFYDDGFYTTPHVSADDGTLDGLLDRETAFLYFLMHGSNALELSGFYGENADRTGAARGMCPAAAASLRRPNVIVTEACYGARFIHYDKAHSMLVSALSAETLIYLGSSRTALGSLEGPLCNADLLAKNFMENLFGGNDAGTAFFNARQGFFSGEISPTVGDFTTILEFNLFGDPTLGVRFDEGAETCSAPRVPAKESVPAQSSVPASPKAMAPDSARLGFSEEKLFAADGNAGKKSLLEQVRSQVNANLARIRDDVNRHLYENFGVKPRELSGVFRVRYADGREELNLSYDLGGADGFSSRMFVAADSRGNVKSVARTL